CPLKYRYIHLLRVPILRHHTVVYGATIHRVVEYYLLRRAVGNYTSLEDLLAVYAREWDNQGFLTWEHEEARKAAGSEALRRFWHEEEAAGQKPTYVEKEFGFSLGPDRVRGRFDRVDEDLLGATIIDYKTGEVARQKVADRRAAESLQLKLYAPEAGRVIRARGGYHAFIPAPLPPKLVYDEDLVRALSRADARLSELSGLGRHLPNPHLLIAPYVRREAVLSSKIEGTTTSLAELLLEE